MKRWDLNPISSFDISYNHYNEGVIMKIDLLDIEKLISVKENNMQEITSSKIAGPLMFDPDGIFSERIFGTRRDEKKGIYAYIDLKRPFLHPHIYGNVLKRMFRSIDKLILGDERFSIKDGVLSPDEDGWTGLAELYKHWDEINWEKSKSTMERAILLLSKVDKYKAFITKMIVCPPAYRDVTLAGVIDKSDYIPDINPKYVSLIGLCNNLLSDGGLFNRQYKTEFKIQSKLLEISDYFQEMITGKFGFIKRHLVGKNVDFGSRSVISAFNYNNETISDNMVGIEYTAVPISQCCATFKPFIVAWLKNLFTREIINNPNFFLFYDTKREKEVLATLVEPEVQFSEREINKIIKDYCLNPDNRFRPLTVKAVVHGPKADKEIELTLLLQGKAILPNNAESVLKRVLTYTDLLYLACVDVCEKRHVMVTRYPVGTDKGLFFSKIRVQSTKSHIKLVFNGKEYPYYPNIDFKIPTDHVGVQFVDSLVFSNCYCPGLGADFDGDTTTIRGIWTDEANAEVEEIMNRKTTALNITGANSRTLDKEILDSYYMLTKDGVDKKEVNISDVNAYLELKPDNFTRTRIAQMFADLNNSEGTKNTKRRKSRHQPWDRMTIPAGYFYDGQKETITTIGKFLFNKYVLEGSGIIGASQLFLGVLNKNGLEAIDELVAYLYLEDKITRQQFNAYIDRRDNLGYWLNGMLVHTISQKMSKPLKAIEVKKAQLLKKYEKEIEAKNIAVMTDIEKELIEYAKDLLGDDPGMELYHSGGLNFKNNFKNNSIIKGPVMNNLTGEYDFIQNSYMDGIEIKDIPSHANSILAGQYPASIATKDAGYMGKKLLALLQQTEIDDPETDCRTKNLIPITVTDKNKKDLIYSYFDSGGQLEVLTRENINSYVGKTIMMRSPMSCITSKICSICAGQLFYKLGVKHAGLFATQVSHTSLNLGLKSKHDTTVNPYYLDCDKIVETI